MSINLKEVAEFMLTNGYILALGRGKYKLSTKFHQEMRQAKAVLPAHISGICFLVPQPLEIFNWESHYKQFIIDARVPARLDNNKGESYQANGYSEKGLKAFRTACTGGIDQNLLRRSVQLYYASTLRFKVAIGRYMEEGIWKTHYDALANAAQQGETQLIDHIKQETQDGQQSSYRLG